MLLILYKSFTALKTFQEMINKQVVYTILYVTFFLNMIIITQDSFGTIMIQVFKGKTPVCSAEKKTTTLSNYNYYDDEYGTEVNTLVDDNDKNSLV